MLHLLYKPPKDKEFILACSGGVDSMAAADFFKRGKKKFRLAYFHHDTPQADNMMNFVRNWGTENIIPVEIGSLTNKRNKGESLEDFWRNERYNWLRSFNLPIITAHHLNDVAETWIFSSLHGNPKIMKCQNGPNLPIRPFLLNTKESMIKWCVDHKVDWLEDESNKNVQHPRNRIRHNIIPECLKINPGLMKVLKKKILAS